MATLNKTCYCALSLSDKHAPLPAPSTVVTSTSSSTQENSDQYNATKSPYNYIYNVNCQKVPLQFIQYILEFVNYIFRRRCYNL